MGWSEVEVKEKAGKKLSFLDLARQQQHSRMDSDFIKNDYNHSYSYSDDEIESDQEMDISAIIKHQVQAAIQAREAERGGDSQMQDGDEPEIDVPIGE